MEEVLELAMATHQVAVGMAYYGISRLAPRCYLRWLDIDSWLRSLGSACDSVVLARNGTRHINVCGGCDLRGILVRTRNSVYATLHSVDNWNKSVI